MLNVTCNTIMTEYQIITPDEEYQLLKFKKDQRPGIAVVNSALKKFKLRIVFNWHLSIILDLEDLIENGMPSKHEQTIIDAYEGILDENIKGLNKEKPNALFLARITWNKTRQLIRRVCDPEPANEYLQEIILQNLSPRQFGYRIDPDNEWELTKWHLNNWR
jgi:hypothetical protein